MKLSEDLFTDVVDIEVPGVVIEPLEVTEVEPEGPAQGADTGIANVIHDLIIDENEAVQGYNNAAANMTQYPELMKLMQDIASEELVHIGELQKALEVVSPNEVKIAEGEKEAEEKLDPGSPIDESIKRKLTVDDIYAIGFDDGVDYAERLLDDYADKNNGDPALYKIFKHRKLEQGAGYKINRLSQYKKSIDESLNLNEDSMNKKTRQIIAGIQHDFEELMDKYNRYYQLDENGNIPDEIAGLQQSIYYALEDAYEAANLGESLYNKEDEIRHLKARLQEINQHIEDGDNPERWGELKSSIFDRLTELGVDNWYDESLEEDFEVIDTYSDLSRTFEIVKTNSPIKPYEILCRGKSLGKFNSSSEAEEYLFDNYDVELNEDTEKNADGKWVNKGEDGEHGEFNTKKEADAQRKAMFANGYHESLKEDIDVIKKVIYDEIASDFPELTVTNVYYDDDLVIINAKTEDGEIVKAAVTKPYERDDNQLSYDVYNALEDELYALEKLKEIN